MEEVASSHGDQAGLLWLLVVCSLFVWGCLGSAFCLFWPGEKKKKRVLKGEICSCELGPLVASEHFFRPPFFNLSHQNGRG